MKIKAVIKFLVVVPIMLVISCPFRANSDTGVPSKEPKTMASIGKPKTMAPVDTLPIIDLEHLKGIDTVFIDVRFGGDAPGVLGKVIKPLTSVPLRKEISEAVQKLFLGANQPPAFDDSWINISAYPYPIPFTEA